MARHRLLVTIAATALGAGCVAVATGTARGSGPTATVVPTVPTAPPPFDDSALGVADGVVPDGDHLSPFDVDVPAVANLTPALRRAVQAAARAAATHGIDLFLTSGWRSRAYQRALLDAAIDKYGSQREARRYVATPDTSRHVTGDAVDIGPTEAANWLHRRGAAFGLCQTYTNEIWHFELATNPGGECPPMQPDASAG